jgi:tetratricopeptide (TPR) repeat protein
MAESDVIQRFLKMTEADPTNELGHFSLGRAYLDAGRFQDAVVSFDRCLELNPNMGRAYQLLAGALLKTGQREKAIERLTQGAKVTSERGEAMAKKDIIAMLSELGAPIPAEATTAAAAPVAGEGQVHCKRCGKVNPKLPAPPMRGEFGREIFENTCASCWREAIGQGTKVINELRLPLDDPKAGKIWDQHIREFLHLSSGT